MLLSTALAGCFQSQEDQDSVAVVTPNLSTATASHLPAVNAYPTDLQRGIDAVSEFEVTGQPCLAKPDDHFEQTHERRQRQREIQSDSHWFKQHLRETYPERLNYSGLDGRRPDWQYIVRLTGSDPVSIPSLGGRAADVPVVVEYNAPWSLAEAETRRRVGSEAARRLIPELQGEGYDEWRGYGAISLDVYSLNGEPDKELLAHCDALRRAYRLPVLVTFIKARITQDMGYE